jgi:superfamily II DNA or RNA helicase
MDAGKANLIIANQVFKKGINIKRVDLIIDCAQRSNKNDVLQKFGRGVRLHSDKKGLLYVDIATVPQMEKQARSRYNALKSAKISVGKCRHFSGVFKVGESLLENST